MGGQSKSKLLVIKVLTGLPKTKENIKDDTGKIKEKVTRKYGIKVVS